MGTFSLPKKKAEKMSDFQFLLTGSSFITNELSHQFIGITKISLHFTYCNVQK
jgi:hypothetical protein